MKGRESGMPAEEYWNSFFDADCVLSKLDCAEPCGDCIEFGCGYGLFSKSAARKISGTLHTWDIDPAMIAITQRRMIEAGVANFQVEQRDFLAEGCGRPDQSADYAMLFNILHIDEPVSLLREAYRVLAPGGKAGIIHWNYDATTPRGPSMNIRPRPEHCRLWAEEAGFEFLRYEPLACCEYHYGLVVQRPFAV